MGPVGSGGVSKGRGVLDALMGFYLAAYLFLAFILLHLLFEELVCCIFTNDLSHGWLLVEEVML